MKIYSTLIALAVATLAIASNNTAFAESTYGYNAAGAGTVTATAKVTTTVAIPKLILLRVGSDDTAVDTVTFNASFIGGIPGGIAAAALTNGNNQASGWNKSAPLSAVLTPAPVLATSWTNSSGGGQLTCSVTTPFNAVSGITSADIAVANTAPLAGGSLLHPGGTTACSGSTSFAKNAVVGSSWTYTLAATNPSAGSYTETITYTATSL